MDQALFIDNLFKHMEDKGPIPEEVPELLLFATAMVGVGLDTLTDIDRRLPAFKNRVKAAFFGHRLEKMAEKFSYGDARRVEAFQNLEKLVTRLDSEWEIRHKPLLASLADRPLVPFAVGPDYIYDRMGRPL